MLLEIIGMTAMGGLLSYTFFDKNGVSEASKIQRVANNCGLNVKEEGKLRTIHLLRKSRHTWGAEYVYRIPLGLSFEDIQKKQKHIEDGLNHKRGLADITLDEIRTLRLNFDIIDQIRKLLNGKKYRKEILMDYDGTLRIRVYNEPLPEIVPIDDKTLESCGIWIVCVGSTREGVLYHNFEKVPHLIVAGTTRYGKSVFLKNVITTLIHNEPNSTRLTLLDLKGGLAFNRFKNTRQAVSVATDVSESLAALQAVHADMKTRQAEFLAKGFEDAKEARLKERHFIIIDEAAELASQGESIKEIKQKKTECEHIISEIARIGGGLGYRLIFATQYPTADTLPRQVKQNVDAKLCFRLQTDIASRVVLDESGAESLPFIKGRAIYRTDRKQIVQTLYIDNEFIDRIIKPHITIKPRKEVPHESSGHEAQPRGEYTLVIEET